MAWSAAMYEGFLLAATLAGDRRAALGRRGLSRTAAAGFEAWMQACGDTTDAERRARITAISRRAGAPLKVIAQQLPIRALALLAPLAEHSLGERWLRDAPPPRAGYQAEPGLRRVLRTIAERGTWDA